MPTRSRKGKNNGNPSLDEGKLPDDQRPTIVDHGKKFAAYDKNGRLIILGYDRKIVKEYADAQSKIRSKR